jgi:hypothetical protein
MKHLILSLFALALLACSCARRSTSMTVLQPAQMKLPDHISAVAVVDRSKPSNGWLNVLEGLISGEAIGQDRASREQAVRGITQTLTRTPRFRVVSTGIEINGSKAGVNLPTPLSWSEVQRICSDYNADAVLCIESFDSNNGASTRRSENKKKDKNGKEYIEYTYNALQRTGVRMGWRLYDPKQQIILDEFVTDDYLERSATGNTERAALANLPSPVSVTREVARIGGNHYASRVAPLYIQVNSRYYKKAKGYAQQMEKADRFARSKDFKKAAEIWKQIEARSANNPKAAGRAAYNMAVAAETEGNYDIAIDWAKRSWEQYGNKKARRYINVLRQRKADAERASSQMNNNV